MGTTWQGLGLHWRCPPPMGAAHGRNATSLAPPAVSSPPRLGNIHGVAIVASWSRWHTPKSQYAIRAPLVPCARRRPPRPLMKFHFAMRFLVFDAVVPSQVQRATAVTSDVMRRRLCEPRAEAAVAGLRPWVRRHAVVDEHRTGRDCLRHLGDVVYRPNAGGCAANDAARGRGRHSGRQ